MSFLLPLALLIGGLMLAPILAHALFRGPKTPLVFPAAHWVPRWSASAKRQNRVEDRALLALRVLLLLALAVLAASPLVRCSRLTLGRPEGGSVAVALVVDDSASMAVKPAGPGDSRLQRSLEAARELLSSAKPGDAFALVLAGQPARLVLPPTSELETVRERLSQVRESDRSTDLAAALDLGRQSLKGLPQPLHQLVLFSDLATAEPLSAADLEGVELPLTELAEPFENCTLSAGRLRGQAVSVELACTKGSPLAGRRVSVHAMAEGSDTLGEAVAELAASEGVLRLTLPASRQKKESARWLARLSADSEHDQLARDDQTELLRDEDTRVLGVRANPEDASPETGGRTVVELGLEALATEVKIEPLSLLPDNAAGLARFSALIIDDPPGFTPETQQALEAWLKEGGVALLLLGPHAARAPLSSGFWPLVRGAPRFEPTPSPGARPEAGSDGGTAWTTWTELDAEGRASLEHGTESRLLVPWTDGAPLVLEQTHGAGLAWVTTLPASLEQSDFALRPAFLALLERVLQESQLRRGSQASAVGQGWTVESGWKVSGPRGPVPLVERDGAWWVEPDVEGQYVATREEAAADAKSATDSGVASARSFVRRAVREPAESLLQPRSPPARLTSGGLSRASAPVSISREVALLALALGALELAARAFQRKRGARAHAGSPDADPSTIPAP